MSSPPDRDSIDPASDRDVRRMLRWLRLAAEVVERDGAAGKKGGDREGEEPEDDDRS